MLIRSLYQHKLDLEEMAWIHLVYIARALQLARKMLNYLFLLLTNV